MDLKILGDEVLIKVSENAYMYYGSTTKNVQELNYELNQVQLKRMVFDNNYKEYVVDSGYNGTIGYLHDNVNEIAMMNNGVFGITMPQNNHTIVKVDDQLCEYKMVNNVWEKYNGNENETVYENMDTLKDIASGILKIIAELKQAKLDISDLDDRVKTLEP